jgi:hypothetical protein
MIDELTGHAIALPLLLGAAAPIEGELPLM